MTDLTKRSMADLHVRVKLADGLLRGLAQDKDPRAPEVAEILRGQQKQLQDEIERRGSTPTPASGGKNQTVVLKTLRIEGTQGVLGG